MSELVLESVSVQAEGKPLFPPVSYCISSQEIFAIMGPSGCGKSTLLSAILGMLANDFQLTGRVLLNQQDLAPLPAHQRRIGLVAQDDWLFPHMTVAQNLMFALPKQGSRRQRRQAIDEALAIAQLSGYQARLPSQLSGGQRQRVAVMRMVLSQPQAILLDEPFSKLDQDLRQSFRQWLYDYLARTAIPTILVSHDHQDLATGRFWSLTEGVMQNA